MSTSIVSIASREAPWQNLSTEIIIGKDILELLSSSMYVDPMTIYREYVQNAADSIQEARADEMIEMSTRGRVDIQVDVPGRNVRITDNGAGVPATEFASRLTAFGDSKKRGSDKRGFRGVGRLAGIGYCQELVFRSRSLGDSKVSEIRWDCRKLKTILRSNEGPSDLREAVSKVVELRRIPAGGDYPERFFEVELRGIVRHRNDQLLNVAAIRNYLSQVAPVPFQEEFPFREQILKHIGDRIGAGEVEIFISGESSPVCRPHSKGVEVSPGIVDPFSEVELIEIAGIDGKTACLGWVLHHGYTGALPSVCSVRGLRVRCGDIQVGDEKILEELFPETRFNAWSVGEFHVIDSRILPNGRRDHFEQSVHFHNLLTHLTPVAREITRRCRTSSIQRKWSRDFELREMSVREKADIIKQGAIGRNDRNRILEEIRAAMVFLDGVIARQLLAPEISADLQKRKEKLERDVSKILKTPVKASPLSNLPSPKRRAYEQVIGLIFECSASQANAKLLVDKILSRIR